MKRSYDLLPPFHAPWRLDLYESLSAALLLSARAERGEARARELYRQSVEIAVATGEEREKVLWALATLEAAMNPEGAAEEGRFPSPQPKPSYRKAFRRNAYPKQPSLSPLLLG
jgi:hypothetical protein